MLELRKIVQQEAFITGGVCGRARTYVEVGPPLAKLIAEVVFSTEGVTTDERVAFGQIVVERLLGEDA
jgi:hypothetical protein